MPRLKNLKHEQFCQEIPKSKSVLEAYQNTFHCEYNSAKANYDKVLERPEVKKRAIEILEGNPKSKLESVLLSITNGLEAKKEVWDGKHKVELIDNNRITECEKTLLKVHAVLDSNTNIDNRSINIVLDEKRLEETLGKLRAISDKVIDIKPQSGD